MLIANNHQSFDYHDGDGKVYPHDCPYFEGKEVCGYLKADNMIDDYELIIHVNALGTEKDIKVPLVDLFAQTNKMANLAKKGLILKPRNVKDAFELLQSQAQNLMRQATIKHMRLGLDNLEKQDVYLQDENILNQKKYRYSGKIKLSNGDKQEYEKFIHEKVFNVKNLTLAFMIGMSAPVVALLAKEGVVSYKAIMVNFAGKSSTGKSTLARLALSPFGNPSFNQDGLGITQNTTENAIYESLDGIHGLPRVLDDINQNARLNMEQLIYSVASGEAKRRAGNSYKDNQMGWSGTVIVTTETPIILDTAQKGGVHARILTLEMAQWASSREEAEQINSIVQTNYGFTGQDFVGHLLTDIDYKERYKAIRKEVDSKITIRDSLTDRIIEQIAAIALTVDCYLRYYPNSFKWSYLNLIEPFIASEQNMVGERDTGEKILNLVREFVLIRRPYFTNYGKIEYTYVNGNVVNQEVYIYRTEFKKLINDNHINDYTAGLNLLKERGQLKTDKDGRLQTKAYGIRAYCFIFGQADMDGGAPYGGDYA